MQLAQVTLPFVAEQLSTLLLLAGGTGMVSTSTTYENPSESGLDGLLQAVFPFYDPTEHPADPTAVQSAIPEMTLLPDLHAFPDLTDPPEKTADALPVLRTALASSGSSVVTFEGGAISNQSNLSNGEVLAVTEHPMPFTLQPSSDPQVLIYHTHATESYLLYGVDWYPSDSLFHRTDEQHTVTQVGDVLEAKLKAAGIGVIHDTTQHDNPSYTGAYDRSRVTIEQYLAAYPSIQIVLDLHRDAVQRDDGTIVAPVTTIDGVQVAQLMFIVCADDGEGSQPNEQKNLAFAVNLQREIEQSYPGLTRATLFSRRYYNQDLSTGALLVEVGTHGNTLAESQRAITLFGQSLINLLQTASPTGQTDG